MDKDSVLIYGGHPLRGATSVQGSKNAALPIIAACALSNKRVELTNVPELSDIKVLLKILEELGAVITFENGVVDMDCSTIENKSIREELCNQLRASSLMMGPLLSRFNECHVGMPGGCSIGNRPLDIHLEGFKKLGAEVTVYDGMVHAKNITPSGDFTLKIPSVGATQNLICFSVLGDETVVLRNTAREPEVMDLIKFLNKAGASITVEDSSTLIIKGVKELKPVSYSIQPDRIEAATLIIATLATKGDTTLHGVDLDDIHLLVQTLTDMGASFTYNATTKKLRTVYKQPLSGTSIQTAVYPGFPTDMQSQMGVLMTQCSTPSTIVENIFNDRLRYCDEVNKMNGKIEVIEKMAKIEPTQLSGCRVRSFDLRGAASMIIAGLCARGITTVQDLHFLYRGYDGFIEKLKELGANIRR